MANQLDLEISARNQFLEELKKTIPALQELKQVSEGLIASERDLGTQMAKSFSAAEKSAAKEAQIRLKQAETISTMTGTVEKLNKANQGSANAAASAVGELKKNEAELQKLYSELQKLDAKGQELISNVARAADAGDTQGIAQLIDEFQRGLDPEQAKAFADGIEEGMTKAENAISRPTKELRELKRQISAGELEGEALQKATLRAAQLADEIGDVQARIKNLSSDTFAVDAVVSGFEGIAGGAAIAQGAMAAFGTENESVNAALLKLNGTMAVLQGIQSVQKVLLEESAAKTAILTAAEKLRGLVTDQTTGKIKAMNVAMLASVGGAIIAGITLLIANWDKVKEVLSGVTAEQAENSRVREAAIEGFADEAAQLEVAKSAIMDNSRSLVERKRILEEQQSKYPAYLGNLDLEKASAEDIAKAFDNVGAAILRKLEIEARQQQLAPLIQEQIELQDAVAIGAKQIAEAEQQGDEVRLAAAKNGNAAFQERINQIEIEKKAILDKINVETRSQNAAGGDPGAGSEPDTSKIDALTRQLAQEKALGRESVDLERRLLREKINITKAGTKERLDAESALATFNNSISKKRRDEALAAEKKLQDDLLSLIQNSEKAKAEALSGEEKINAELIASQRSVDVLEQSLLEELAKTKLAGEERAKAEAQIEEAIGILRNDAIRKAADQRIALRQEEFARERAEMEQMQSDDATFFEEQQQLEAIYFERSLLEQQNNFTDQQEFEKFKTDQLRQFKIKQLQDELTLLEQDNNEKTKVRREQIRNQVLELTNEAKAAANSQNAGASGIDGFLTKLFGLDDQGLGELKQAAASIANDLGNIISQAAQAQIQQAEQQISAIDELIAKQEEAVVREQELAQQGKANSVNTEKQRLAELKKQREQAVRDQVRARKIQAGIETAEQAGSLLTAGAKLFADGALKGPLGIALAVSTIAAMFAAFQRFKSIAAQAAQPVQLERGGYGDTAHAVISGRRHSEGGEKFTDHIEVEHGEMWGVLNRNASRKYNKEFGEIVEAMNAGKFRPSMPARPAFFNITQSPEFEVMKMGSNGQMSALLSKVDSLTEEVSILRKDQEARERAWSEGNTSVVKKGAHVTKTTVRVP